MQSIDLKELNKVSGGMCCVIIAPNNFKFSGDKCMPGVIHFKKDVSSYEAIETKKHYQALDAVDI